MKTKSIRPNRVLLAMLVVLALVPSVGSARDTATSTGDSPGPICVDKTWILLDKANARRLEMLKINNISGLIQTVGIELPEKGLLLSEVVRKPEQLKLSRDVWHRFTLPANSGIFIVLMPETYPERLAMLDGKNIVIKLYHGNEVQQTLRIPIKVSADLRPRPQVPSIGSAALPGKQREGAPGPTEAPHRTSLLETWRCPRKLAPGSRGLPGGGAQRLSRALIKAAEQGDVAAVKALLAKGADVNAKDWRGATPLTAAARKGRVELAKALLDRGANPNVQDDNYETPLIAAADQGHVNMVKLLLARGAAVNGGSMDGRTALTVAAGEGRLKAMTVLLEKDADVHAKTKGGWTALMWAAERGHAASVKALLDKGANVNAKDTGGWTALMSAAAKGNSEVVDLLLAAGADVNAQSKVPFWSWRASGSWRVNFAALRKFLKEEGEGDWTPLMSAAAEGHTKVVKALVQKGADVNAQSRFDWTPLKIARNMGYGNIAEFLKASGAKE